MEQHQTDINTQKDKCRLFELGIGKLRCNALWAGTQYSLGCFTSMPRQHQLQYPHRTCTITNNLCISNLSDRLIAESICEFNLHTRPGSPLCMSALSSTCRLTVYGTSALDTPHISNRYQPHFLHTLGQVHVDNVF